MSADIDRADRMLVRLGHFDSRAAAQAAIAARQVRADGQIIHKPAQKISDSARIEARPAHPYVSRGGTKLAHALKQFELDVRDRKALDIGASTGGFSQVLLDADVACLVAVDVGSAQLHQSLRQHPRLSLKENQDARDLTFETIGFAPSVIVCDVSFISLNKILDRPLSLAAPDADLICLFKPQFEVGRRYIGKGGLVRDKQAVQHAEKTFRQWLRDRGWPVIGATDSPITGGDGNQERLIWARRIKE